VTASGARATVVVANPDQTVCEVLARLVEAGGHEAVRITDPDRVVDAVGGSLAVGAVLDLGPGTADAVQALRADGAAGEAVRLVAVATGPANAHLAWQAGADAVLTRPFPAGALGEELAAALARSDADRQRVRAEALATPPS
jgi:DNA-binding response OmpR family regulator